MPKHPNYFFVAAEMVIVPLALWMRIWAALFFVDTHSHTASNTMRNAACSDTVKCWANSGREPARGGQPAAGDRGRFLGRLLETALRKALKRREFIADALAAAAWSLAARTAKSS
jgi:hypothetical protein